MVGRQSARVKHSVSVGTEPLVKREMHLWNEALPQRFPSLVADDRFGTVCRYVYASRNRNRPVYLDGPWKQLSTRKGHRGIVSMSLSNHVRQAHLTRLQSGLYWCVAPNTATVAGRGISAFAWASRSRSCGPAALMLTGRAQLALLRGARYMKWELGIFPLPLQSAVTL